MCTPERSRGRFGASCGASKPALARPLNDDVRVFNQVLFQLSESAALYYYYTTSILLLYYYTIILLVSSFNQAR